MKSVNLKYSKSQIDRAGDQLKSHLKVKKEREEALNILSNWRAYHAMPLDTFAKVLKARVEKISKSNNAIVAQRLKRTPSILLKLQNHKTMRLSTMQDIGGLRAIFDSVEEVYQLLDLYRFSKTRHQLFSLNNYIENPKEDGYRGIHMVYKLSKKPSVFIEIQIRSHLQHIWATGVEVFGTLQSSSFKSGMGDKKWLDFFKQLSSIFALKEKSQIEDHHKRLSKTKLLKQIQKMIQDLKVIEQLSVYTAIYKTNSIKAPRGRMGHYSLIVLDSNENTVTVNTFSMNQIEKATREYIDLEKKYYDDKNINVVLVNTGDIKKLEISYPNYFMDTKSLVQALSLIMMDKYL